MPKLKLTKDAIRRLPAPDPSGRQVLYWDEDLKGFGVLVSGKTDVKSFVVQREVNGHTRRVTLLTLAQMEATDRDIKDIRNDAGEMLIGMSKGKDPKAHRGPKANVTLGDRLNGGGPFERWLKDWSDRPLREITPEMVEKRYKEIKATVAKRNGTNVHPDRHAEPGAATATGVMRVLRKLWNDAQHEVPELPANPVGILTRKKLWDRIPERERYVRGEDLPKFYQSVRKLPSLTMRDYLLLVLFTGLRRSEAESLRWDDIDFAQKFIRVPSWRTKNRRMLDLPVSDFVNDLLVGRRKLGVENEYVFPANSKTGHLEEPKKALREVGKVCGVNVSVHDLRRTFVTVASLCYIPPMSLSGLVNHSPGSSITAGYARLTAAELVEPMQIVTDRMKVLCKVRQRLAG